MNGKLGKPGAPMYVRPLHLLFGSLAVARSRLVFGCGRGDGADPIVCARSRSRRLGSYRVAVWIERAHERALAEEASEDGITPNEADLDTAARTLAEVFPVDPDAVIALARAEAKALHDRR